MNNMCKNDDHENRNEPSYKILQDLELERKRIARELHDSTIQMLTMLIYKVEICENIVDKDTVRTKMELDIMKKVIKDTIDDIRNTIYNLHPMSIEDLGLVASLERYLIILKRDSSIDFTLNVEGEEKKCISIINLCLYRIVQECCNNIIKHSKGTKASVHIIFSDESIKMNVKDNGVGISKNINISNCELDVLKSDSYKNGYGIPMMIERVHLLGGSMDIKTGIGGTDIMVYIPLSFNKEDENKND